MHQTWITMEGKDDGFIRGEKGIELFFGFAMRMLVLRLQLQ